MCKIGFLFGDPSGFEIFQLFRGARGKAAQLLGRLHIHKGVQGAVIPQVRVAGVGTFQQNDRRLGQRYSAGGKRHRAAIKQAVAPLLPGAQPWLRLRISDGGRQYVVKSIPALLDDVEHGRSAGYGRFLTFVHRWDAFDEESRQLLQLLRRQVNAKQSMETNVVRSYSYAASDAPAGGLPLTGEIFDALVQLYAPTGTLGGPSLLFVTMQNVFDRMGAAGPIFGILFYLLVVFAAVSSSISLLEAVVAHFVDKARDEGKGDKRKLYSLIGAIGAGILCVIVCLDALGNAGISPADILGMRVDPSDKVPTWSADWLDFFDCIAEGILMPLGALLMSIMYGWELGPEVVHAEATCEGQKFGAYGWFRICIKYITPLAMLLVLYGQIKEFFF